MREFGLINPFRLFTGGKLLLLLGALMATLISFSVVFSPTAGAADATWDSGNIIYEDKTFRPNNIDGIHQEISAPDGSVIYQYGGGENDSTAEFIYFANPDTVSTADTAQYLSFDWNHGQGEVSNRDGPHTISIDIQAETQGATNEETSSCEVDAIGWIVCPVTNFLATGTDWLFDRLTTLLAVPPLFGDTDSPLYRIWQMMLGLANLAFILFFVIIIYSQITSIGISNYGIKRLIPRLIIAAIAVNVSYYICALAVDISNILGFSLQEMFFNMRNDVVQVESGNGWQIHTFEDIATVVLSGSVAGAAALGIATHSLLASGITSAIIMLLPTLVGVGLAILLAILILAARQAVITVLIILSPLAIVAYLLPNTEKWFEKWRATFMTMLLLFPIFSVLFGGAQLAGTAIIQNAGSLDVIILGMATQVAPLVITPFLIKFSGSLLGRIAGMVNNPNKGLIDRSRNFAKEKAEHTRAKRTANLMSAPPRRRRVLRRAARAQELRRRTQEAEREVWKSQADEGWTGTDAYKDLQGRLIRSQHNTQTIQQTVESDVKAKIQADINTRGTQLHLDYVNLEEAKGRLAAGSAKTESILDEYRTRKVADTLTGDLGTAVRSIQSSHEAVSVQALRKQSANYVRQREFANLLGNEDPANPEFSRTQAALREAAGIDPTGRLRAQSDAMSNLVKLDDEELKKSLQLLNARAIRENTTVKEYTSRIANDAIYRGIVPDKMLVKAAIEYQANDGQVGVIQEALGSRHIDHDDLFEIISRNVGTMKSKGGFHIQADPGSLSIHTIEEKLRAEHARAGKAAPTEKEIRTRFEQQMAFSQIDTFASSSAENIADFKVGYFSNFAENLEEHIENARKYAEATGNTQALDKNLSGMYFNIHTAIENEDIAAKMSDRRDQLAFMDDTLKRYDIKRETPKKLADEHRTQEDRDIDNRNG